MKWEPKRRGLVSGHGPVPKTPPPPVSSVMPEKPCTAAYYVRKIAELELEATEAYAHGVNNERKAAGKRVASELECMRAERGSFLCLCTDCTHDANRLVLAAAGVTENDTEVSACNDCTHRPTCDCGAEDPDDVRDRKRERAWDGE